MDAGHFALVEANGQIAALIPFFLDKQSMQVDARQPPTV
jgi:hypothetical protein